MGFPVKFQTDSVLKTESVVFFVGDGNGDFANHQIPKRILQFRGSRSGSLFRGGFASALLELFSANFPDKAGGPMPAIKRRIGTGPARFHAIFTIGVFVLAAYNLGVRFRMKTAFSSIVVEQVRLLLDEHPNRMVHLPSTLQTPLLERFQGCVVGEIVLDGSDRNVVLSYGAGIGVRIRIIEDIRIA